MIHLIFWVHLSEWVSEYCGCFLWNLALEHLSSILRSLQCTTLRDKCSNITREKSEIQNEMWEITIDIKERAQNTWQREFAGNVCLFSPTSELKRGVVTADRWVAASVLRKIVPGKTHSHNTFSSDRTKTWRSRTCNDLSLTFKFKQHVPLAPSKTHCSVVVKP